MSLLTRILTSLVPGSPNVPTSIVAPSKYGAGEALYFPSNLSSNNGLKRYPHMMKFSVYNFEGGGNPADSKGNFISRAISKDSIKTIFLHIPDNLAQTLTHEWSTESITTALANYGLVGALIEDVIKIVKSGNFSLEDIGTDEPGITETVGRILEAVGGAGAGTTEILTSFKSNAAVNPRYEAIYKATRPREFTFDFKLSPKDQEEASSILNIIKSFRYFSTPEKDDANARYLRPPNPFKIEFYFAQDGQLNNALFKIDNCVLQGVDVNYATTGQFATFNDGMPVEIAMQLRFVEIQALTRDKIEEGF